MRANVTISVSPQELAIIKSALDNYITRIDNTLSKDLGFEVERRCCKEKRMIIQMQKDMGIQTEE